MNFYKITNKGEKHNGLQYKTGLNVDPLPWDPSGDCKSGGIYFSREDIFAFLIYGCWVRKVTIPEDVEVYENPGEPKKWKAHKVILGKRRKIDINVIKSLIEEGTNIHADDDWALRWASRKGHLEVVKLLIEHGANVNARNDWALKWASRKGHLKIVKLLLNYGVHADNGWALVWASENGHLAVVKLLIAYGANVHVYDDEALECASENGHTKVVDLLLKHGAAK